MDFPIEFAERMEQILKTEYAAFTEVFENGESVKGLRVNTAKLTADQLLRESPFPLTAIPYTKDGFIVAREDAAGKHPYHHAGVYYMQDPGAMATVAAIPDEVLDADSMKVLDLCSAPGGKSTELAARILPKNGILLSNEYNAQRSRILAGNIERMGLPNVCVTNLDTAVLAERYPDVFDLVVCDAPCSGEGMFRKNDRAIEEWSLSNVALSAARQREILGNGAACVAPGGYLLYSTCTYSIEENEQNVAHFLSEHPDFSLVPCKESVVRHTADGISDGIDTDADLTLCRRFYPHLTPGEGQFIALLRRDPDAPVKKHERSFDKSSRQSAGTGFTPPMKADLDAANAFLSETIGKTLPGIAFRGGNLILMPVLTANPLPIVSAGTVALGAAIGEARKGRIVPHHHFFMAYGREMKNQLILDPLDERVTRYLAGEEIEIPSSLSGFTAVLLSVGETAVTLGGGKASGGRLKNYYPKGLRAHL